jgi:hypothetical protein
MLRLIPKSCIKSLKEEEVDEVVVAVVGGALPLSVLLQEDVLPPPVAGIAAEVA